ncbi:protein-glutamate O-methyltransferase CheR [Telmatobacter sp. DSM 110680]|uniref:protein-glutamate O-methyltransferase n=1 Tax=Telmatobacter sp. DSM 110680 TaxID=3036704 RepID=A0AAU7DLK9_9BACT
MAHVHTAEEEELSSRDFGRLRELIYTETGICLSPEKKTMVEVRLKRRLRTLNMATYTQYCDFVFGREGMREELVFLINVITTNKTDFFREPQHFEFLTRTALPELAVNSRSLVIWSAGCSSGEEPYTLAMLLSEYAEAHPGFRFRILASDISTEVLEKAEMGIYSSECVTPVPLTLKRKYLLRSRDSQSPRVRVTPELRRLIDFRHLNLMESDYMLAQKVDAIFCRNVLIYFDRATQENILCKLVDNLTPSGYLFVGHSETLHDMDLPVVPVAPALYRKAHAPPRT